MDSGAAFLATGLLLGLTAGISPGPLLTLVISETLKHGKVGGIKVATAPLITDFPIVVAALLLLNSVSRYHTLLGVISLSGGLFILYFAYQCITMKAVDSTPHSLIESSLKKGIILNLLNPHPYIFWISVGGPMVGKAMRLDIIWAILFVSGFYIMLVGSKVVVAILVEITGTFLSTKAYLYTMKTLGIILVVFAYFFIKEGLSLLRGGEGGLGPS